jgi:hypothetical protein
MNTISVQLAQATGKGIAVSFDGSLAEDPTADAYAGVTLEAGETGDYVGCVAIGEEVLCKAAGTISVGQALGFTTDGEVEASTVANAGVYIGTCSEAASAGDMFRARLAPFHTPAA